MLHAMLKIFGLTPVQPVKRPPTARTRALAAPLVKPTHSLADDHPRRLTYEEREQARALVTITTLGAACRVYARYTGEFGRKPSPQELAQARRIMGLEGWAYLQARTLHGRKAPQIGVNDVGDRDKERGLHFRVSEGIEDLDLWSGIAPLEEAAAKEAKGRGQRPPTPIVIPPRILKMLEEREKLRLARIEKAGAKGKGGPRVTPSEPAAPETVADPAQATETAPVDPAPPAPSDPTLGEDDPSTPRKP